MRYIAPPFILELLFISSVWDYVPFNFKFAGYMTALQTLDAIALNKARQSRRPESTLSPSEARAQMGAVDHVSEHQTIEILLRFGDRGRHEDASEVSDLHRTGER